MVRLLALACCALTLSLGAPVLAQNGGGGQQPGEIDYGDLFGDLVEIERSAAGQQVLEMRWAEYPMDVLGWRFCPIPIDAEGNEIGFLPLSCEAADPLAVVEIDYFGRLSAARTREQNIRMHFDEVIATINDPAVTLIDRDPGNRLRIHSIVEIDGVPTPTVKVIDSPQENLALYTRVMKYGHIQTNPLEPDLSFHGDPALGVQYHPALTPEARAKFDASVADLLSNEAEDDECFVDPALTPDADPCGPEYLTSNDLALASGYLGGAADKHGRISIDLVQYLNRILRITKATSTTSATLATLPVLVRTCDKDGVVPVPTPPPEEEGEVVAAAYEGITLPCGVYAAADPALVAMLAAIDAANEWVWLPAGWQSSPEKVALLEKEIAAEKAAVAERVVDYSPLSYARDPWFPQSMPVVMHVGEIGAFVFGYIPSVPLLPYLYFVNGDVSTGTALDGFVKAASDGVRSVEFIHTYEVPEDLGWRYDGFVAPATGVTLTANPPSPQVAGTAVTFTAEGEGSTSAYDYRFWTNDGDGWVIAQDYGNGSTFALQEAVPGTYWVAVWVRTTDTVAADAYGDPVAFTYTSPTTPATAVGLSADLASPSGPGVPVTFTAAGSGSTTNGLDTPAEGYDYQFWLDSGSGWAVAQGYGNGATFTLAAPVVGTYRVAVWVRTTDGVEADVYGDALTHVVAAVQATPATAVTLGAAPPSPSEPGVPVTFTASGSGSTTGGLDTPAEGYDYQFWLDSGSGWAVAQEYGNGATYTLGAPAPGVFRVAVWVRTTGGVAADVYGDAVLHVVE